MTYSYSIASLSVCSELELPGALPTCDDTRADVEIVRRAVPEALSAPTATGPTWQIDGRSFLLRLPRIGRLLANDGNLIAFEEATGTLAQDFLPFVMGTGIGAILYQRGGIALHASCVADDGRAYAICGPAGSGKSTLAAALCALGCEFVSDDILAVASDTVPRVWPDGRQLRLHEASIRQLGLQEYCRGAVRAGSDKQFVDPPRRSTRPLPTGAIYVFRNAGPWSCPPGITRLAPLDAAQILLNECYRRRMAMRLGKADRHLAFALSVLRQVPMFILARPRDLSLVSITAGELKAHWRALAE